MRSILGDLLEKGKFWTDAWSLVEGCSPVSAGCDHCWMAGIKHRFEKESPFLNAAGMFNGHILFREDRLSIPLRHRRSRVYAVWSDLFIDSLWRGYQRMAFSVMQQAQQHRFLVVTKHPEVAVAVMSVFGLEYGPLRNVIFLVTIENPNTCASRMEAVRSLCRMGWRVGLLYEPLLGPAYLIKAFEEIPPVEWVIAGGETGPGARPSNPEWFRLLRDQCAQVGVPFLFKSHGEFVEAPPIRDWKKDMDIKCLAYDGSFLSATDRVDYAVGDRFVLRVGKKKAGRLLDGVLHDGVPAW